MDETEDLSQYPLELTGAGVPMVRFQKVAKRYGSLIVLEHLDLDVAEGEMVTIVGPSGSGKTTVLRTLMTLENINEGVIYVDGKPLTHMEKDGKLVPASQKYLRSVRSKIGMCFQHFNLFPHMTALENCMEGPVHVLGIPRKQARERSEELLEMVGMGDKRNQHPSRLSGGQQQRVAIARALAMRPKVMLFDEVTSALDPEVIVEVTNVIRRLVSDYSLTMLMVTHQMGFARDIADRVCFFFGGRIEEQGTPEQLFGNPQRKRTQQFLSAVKEAV
ncbi:ectoine/hydroxyectoine ABC transporter ATP-binding protein EhuA [Mesorhizobium sp. M0676]|uniref:ectoine/hydroxyectoine ABC transporter ATP-binding protein EhuA n=1 Tax=Mesorhizobium sp. M0676 TaxID=2956984 RepID=UPI003337D2C5